MNDPKIAPSFSAFPNRQSSHSTIYSLPLQIPNASNIQQQLAFLFHTPSSTQQQQQQQNHPPPPPLNKIPPFFFVGNGLILGFKWQPSIKVLR